MVDDYNADDKTYEGNINLLQKNNPDSKYWDEKYDELEVSWKKAFLTDKDGDHKIKALKVVADRLKHYVEEEAYQVALEAEMKLTDKDRIALDTKGYTTKNFNPRCLLANRQPLKEIGAKIRRSRKIRTGKSYGRGLHVLKAVLPALTRG